jgi:drug/metabolite transporter (DMT)-like permease
MKPSAPAVPPAAKELHRKSAIAFGIACVALLFLLETWVAHQRLPNAASPWVWGLLGALAIGGTAIGVWLRAQAAKIAP